MTYKTLVPRDRLQAVDYGQVVTYDGDRPVETATNGLRRVGSHSRYGFGELRLKPLVDHSEGYGRV